MRRSKSRRNACQRDLGRLKDRRSLEGFFLRPSFTSLVSCRFEIGPTILRRLPRIGQAGMPVTSAARPPEARHRCLPLNRDAVVAVAERCERSEDLTAAEQEHYVFPSCELGHFDASRPMKNWRRAWRALTKVAELRGCGSTTGGTTRSRRSPVSIPPT